MISALEKEITLRYLKTRKKDGFLNIISIFSFIGISLGVAVLIIVMSVMNGFRSELINKIVGFNAHVTVKPYETSINLEKLNSENLKLISKELMKTIPFPENYGHYGLDDTYLMWGANILQDPTIKQFKLKNIVVCENYFDRITTYKGEIQFIDKREEFKKYNEQMFHIGLENLIKNKQQ